MSAATGVNPFGKTNGMTQPVNQTRSVKDYEGNVDFAREKTLTQFNKTVGNDLNIRNPYLEKEKTV